MFRIRRTPWYPTLAAAGGALAAALVGCAMLLGGCDGLRFLELGLVTAGGVAQLAGSNEGPSRGRAGDTLVNTSKVSGPPGPGVRTLHVRAFDRAGRVALELQVTEERTCVIKLLDFYRRPDGSSRVVERLDSETCDTKLVAGAPVEVAFADGARLVAGETNTAGLLLAEVPGEIFREHAAPMQARVAGVRITTADEALGELAGMLRTRKAAPAQPITPAATPAASAQ